MKRIILWLAVALTTFTLGVVTTMVYVSGSASTKSASVPCPAIKYDVLAVPTSFPGLSRTVKKLNTPSYFPKGAFDPKPEREQFKVEWYTQHLKAMGEQSIFSQTDASRESYRFLWLRSFHHPVAVRVWSSGDGHFINVKQMDGQGGYQPGKLITDQTRPLTNAEWNHFLSLLDRSCYWQLPTRTDDIGFDGAQWILEGVREGRYHVVDRWTPDSGDFREACLYLLKASNLAIDLSGKDIY
jgi:hypothetical protein